MTTYRDYTDEEIERRGEAIYAERIRSLVEEAHRGEYVVINIESGEWEMGDDVLKLSRALHAKHPEGALYTLRVGHDYVVRLGGHVVAHRP